MWRGPEGTRRPFALPGISADALGMSWARVLVMDINILGVGRTVMFTLSGSAGSRYDGLEPKEEIKNWKDAS